MLDDRELVQKFINGDTESFYEIVERNKDKVINIALGILCNPCDADDIAQEVFIKFFMKPKSFKGESKLSTWLYRVTVNMCLDHLRKNKKHLYKVNLNDEEILNIKDNTDVSRYIQDNELKDKIRKVLMTIDEKYRTVLVLKEIDNMSYKEIADILNISEDNVRVILFRAKEKFRAICSENNLFSETTVNN